MVAVAASCSPSHFFFHKQTAVTGYKSATFFSVAALSVQLVTVLFLLQVLALPLGPAGGWLPTRA